MGIWPGHRGYTPTLYEKCHGMFNDHRESGPRFNVSFDTLDVPKQQTKTEIKINKPYKH